MAEHKNQHYTPRCLLNLFTLNGGDRAINLYAIKANSSSLVRQHRLANRNDQRIAAMLITRNNHYVPRWYQDGFFEPGRSSLAYVDLTPDGKELPDGRVIIQRGSWDDTPTSKAFRQKDLYSTFFGTSVNDEIERHLFGGIDRRGSKAVRAFARACAAPCWRSTQSAITDTIQL
jgi:hypothetical protein